MPRSCHAIRVHEPGDPEVMRWEEVEVPDPGPGEVLLRQTAVGLNFIDVSQRRGTYPAMPDLPAVMGMEAAGVIEAVGDGVTGYGVGDRISYCMVIGAYAELRVMTTDRFNKLPDTIPDEIAAASILQGLTAHYLLHDSHPVQAGETVLVHAAAGGMGTFLCQWAKAKGVTVLGTVSTDEKAELARAHGCDHPIVYTRDDFAEAVMDLTGGNGVNAIYDAIGKDTFETGMTCLASRGRMVSYGQASGPVPPIDVGPYALKALSIIRTGLNTYTRDNEERARRAADLWEAISSGTLKVEINQRMPLADAAKAHTALEGRQTTGSTVFTV